MSDAPMIRKDASLETLRVLAVALVVAYHLVNDVELRAVREVYAHLSFTVQNIRLPLFTVISGYLYGKHPAASGSYPRFMQGKMRRIYLPMVVIASLEFLAVSQFFGGEKLGNIARIFYLPYEHYWFVQAIILIFALYGWLDSAGALRRTSALVGVSLASIAVFFFWPNVSASRDIFSIGGATYLLPYFGLGYLWARNARALEVRWIVAGMGVAAVLLLVLQEGVWRGAWVADFSKKSVLGLAVGVCVCSFLLAARPAITSLAPLGKYVFAIYLFQGFGAAIGRRIGALFVGVSPHLYFLIALLVTIAFGCIAAVVLAKTRLTALLFLGERKKKVSRQSSDP